jgi:hypothetical protein
MAANVGLQKLWLFEGKRKKYFVFVRYKVQDNFCLTTYMQQVAPTMREDLSQSPTFNGEP